MIIRENMLILRTAGRCVGLLIISPIIHKGLFKYWLLGNLSLGSTERYRSRIRFRFFPRPVVMFNARSF